MKTPLGRMLVAGLGLLAAGLQAQPVITNQPAGLLVVAGGNATFSVMATGTAHPPMERCREHPVAG